MTRILLALLWKGLMFFMAGVLIYAALSATSTFGTVVILAFAALFFIVGVFTELGEQ